MTSYGSLTVEKSVFAFQSKLSSYTIFFLLLVNRQTHPVSLALIGAIEDFKVETYLSSSRVGKC